MQYRRSESNFNKKRYSRCRICQKFRQLTKEHVPPAIAFNKGPYREYYVDQVNRAELLQWTSKEVNANGIWVFSLCETCNRKTGNAYAHGYGAFVQSFTDVATPDNANKDVEIEIKNLFPARVVKQVVSMVLSTSNPDSFRGHEGFANPFPTKQVKHLTMDVFGARPDPGRLREVYGELRNFVRKRDAKGLSAGVRLFAFAVANSGDGVRTGILGQASLSKEKSLWGVVVGLWPIHWLMTFQDSEPLTPLLEVTNWAKEDYKTKRTLKIKIPCLWSVGRYPLDFRTPQELQRDRFITNMQFEGFVRDEDLDDEEVFEAARAFARRRGKLTLEGIFLRQCVTGTYAEYKGQSLWCDGCRLKDVREFLDRHRKAELWPVENETES
jgi:hypothetical protein